MNFFGNLGKAIRDFRYLLENYDLMHGRDASWHMLNAQVKYLVSLQEYQNEGSFEAQIYLFSAEKQMLEVYLEYKLNEEIEQLNRLYDEWSYFASHEEAEPYFKYLFVAEKEAAYIRSKIKLLEEQIQRSLTC